MHRACRISSLICLGLIVGLVTQTVWAQDDQNDDQKQDDLKKNGYLAGDDDGPEKPARPALRAGKDPRDGKPGRPAGGMLDRWTKELNLTPEQVTTIKGILDKQREAARAGGPGVGIGQSDDLIQRMQEARKAGNDEEVKKIREEIRAKMDERRKAAEASRDDMYTQVAAVLTPEQLKKFEEIKSGGGGGKDRSADPGSLHRAVNQLKLGEEQKAKVDALFNQFRESVKALPHGDRSARDDLAKKLKADVVNALTEDQVKELEKSMQSGDRRHARAGRPGARPGRGGKGEDKKTEDTGG